jgi:hypothetical protein
MFRFILFEADGGDAGEFATAVRDWRPGDVFQTDDGRHLRIRATIPLELIAEFHDRPVYELWEVEPVG